MRQVVVIGAGGHAKVLIESLRRAGTKVLAALDQNHASLPPDVLGIPVAGGDELLKDFNPADVEIANGIGSVGSPETRMRVFNRMRALGYRLATIVDPTAIVASDVQLGEGAQVLAGCVIQPGCRIGENTIINTRASVDHDCHIGPHVHIAPGVTLSGSVQIGAECHVGTAAAVIQGIRIGARALVGAGAVVVRDISDGEVVVGVPARARTR